MKKLLYCIFVLFLTIGFGVFGWINRQSYTNITDQPGYLNQFAVAESSEQRCIDSCQEMKKTLPNAPVIARVTPISDIEPQFGIYLIPLQVIEVYAGDVISVGEEIWMGRQHKGLIVEREGGRYAEFGFVNIPQQGREYLVFLSNRVIADGDRTICFLQESDTATPVPMFCYDDIPNVIETPDGVSTYVPYSEVSSNEFFVTTQVGLDAMLELKESLLKSYPR